MGRLDDIQTSLKSLKKIEIRFYGFYVCNKIVIKIGAKKIILGGSVLLNPPVRRGRRLPHPHRMFRTQAPNDFGLNPHSQLVIGYHWLAFLNQIHKNIFKSPIHYEC